MMETANRSFPTVRVTFFEHLIHPGFAIRAFIRAKTPNLNERTDVEISRRASKNIEAKSIEGASKSIESAAVDAHREASEGKPEGMQRARPPHAAMKLEPYLNGSSERDPDHRQRTAGASTIRSEGRPSPRRREDAMYPPLRLRAVNHRHAVA